MVNSRIFKSSNFWNAVFFSLSGIVSTVCMIAILKFIGSNQPAEMVAVIKDFIFYQFILFGGRTVMSGAGDLLKTYKGVGYNPETGKDEKM